MNHFLPLLKYSCLPRLNTYTPKTLHLHPVTSANDTPILSKHHHIYTTSLDPVIANMVKGKRNYLFALIDRS